MKKLLTYIAVGLLVILAACTHNNKKMATIYDFKALNNKGEIRWNFTKFLISKDGTEIKRFPPTAKPEEMENDIEAMLK